MVKRAQKSGAACQHALELCISKEERNLCLYWTSNFNLNERIAFLRRCEEVLKSFWFLQAMWAAYERDYESANAWASQGMKHSEEVIKACVEAETVLYKHRHNPPRRRANRLIGPLDLIGLSEKEAIQTLEEELRRSTTKKNRSSRFPEQKLSLLLGSQKVWYLTLDFILIHYTVETSRRSTSMICGIQGKSKI